MKLRTPIIHPNEPAASCPFPSRVASGLFLHFSSHPLADQDLGLVTHSCSHLTRILLSLAHPSHLGRLHLQILAAIHTSPIKAKVLTTDTSTLKNVTVLTAHPNSFPLNSHRSYHNGHTSGLWIGVRRGHGAGLGTQAEDCSGQP